MMAERKQLLTGTTFNSVMNYLFYGGILLMIVGYLIGQHVWQIGYLIFSFGLLGICAVVKDFLDKR